MAKKLLLSLVSCLLALGAAEVAVRALGLAPEVTVIQKGRFRLARNPKIGYEPVPNLDYRGPDRSFWDYAGASNSQGFRDREHAVAKPPGVYRVVVLGDSIAAGLKIERVRNSFPPRLERLLGERGLPAEVISLAVSGYNTRQEVELFKEKGLRYRPDLVLVAYSLTDRERMDGDILRTLLAAEGQESGVAAVRVHPLLVRSALYRALRYRVLAPIRRTPAQAAAATERAVARISGDTVAESFAELARLSQAHGFAVVVAVFPRLVGDFRRYRFGDQHEFVAALSRRHGFRHLDLLAPLAACRAAAPEKPLGMDSYHPSPYGHACVAAAMVQAILELEARGTPPS
ncbi:MAG TPA: SGNH/GDSL hydrolase family protein [Thermoanaerobaculia bacterium]|nr:SGNH/GDSL hydrolase family protein [Thermoanaerobaculia bacterium]